MGMPYSMQSPEWKLYILPFVFDLSFFGIFSPQSLSCRSLILFFFLFLFVLMLKNYTYLWICRRMDDGRFGFPMASRRSSASRQKSAATAICSREIQNGLVQQQDQYRLGRQTRCFHKFLTISTILNRIKNSTSTYKYTIPFAYNMRERNDVNAAGSTNSSIDPGNSIHSF